MFDDLYMKINIRHWCTACNQMNMQVDDSSLQTLCLVLDFSFHFFGVFIMVFVCFLRVARFRFLTWPPAAFSRQLMPMRELSGPCVCLQIR